MDYTVKSFKIKSNWFDENGKFSKMGSDTLNLYFSLFKFRLHGQSNEYTFLTSIYHLRKETGYSKSAIFLHLKSLIKLKIIEINNVKRWDRFLSSNNSIPEKNILEIVAIDAPLIDKITDESGNTTDKPKTEDDYYISVETALLNLYNARGLSHKYYPIYCLIKKLQNGSVEKKAFMSIEKMALWIGYNKDYTNKLVHNMNRSYVLYSDYRDNGKGGKYFEHHLMSSTKEEGFLKAFKSDIDKNIKKWDKKKEKSIQSDPFENEYESSYINEVIDFPI